MVAVRLPETTGGNGNVAEDVGPREAEALVREGALLLDVREQREFDAGHAPDAAHLPMSTLGERYTELPADRRIVAVCRSGNRSGQVARALSGAGYDIVNLVGGMQAWRDQGMPVVSDAGPGTVV